MEVGFNINQHQTTPEGGLRGHPRHELLAGRHLTGVGMISGLFLTGFGMNFNKFWEAGRGSLFSKVDCYSQRLAVILWNPTVSEPALSEPPRNIL